MHRSLRLSTLIPPGPIIDQIRTEPQQVTIMAAHILLILVFHATRSTVFRGRVHKTGTESQLRVKL